MTDKHVTFARLWTSGMKVKDIARTMNVCKTSIREMRVALNLPPRNVLSAMKPRHDASKHAATIRCLCCSRKFKSEDRRNNRVCGSCKSLRAWRDGQDYSATVAVR